MYIRKITKSKHLTEFVILYSKTKISNLLCVPVEMQVSYSASNHVTWRLNRARKAKDESNS